ncbi:MAG: hypothetical protein NXI31_17270 [bacterium]|nr:hypothetical protein [bacterium]
MSYRFGNDAILSDTTSSAEVADGVTMARRSVLRLSAATLAAAFSFSACRATGRGASRATPEPLPADTIDLAEFFTRSYPRAQAFIAAGGPLEEAYLMGVAELMARLQVPTKAACDAQLRTEAEARGVHPRALEFAVVMFDLDPGKGFEHHDHRDYNGVILGVDGEIRCRNFDIVGDDPVPPKGSTFQIRQTRDDLLLPGRFSTLSRTRDNVHEVVAGPDGARMLDVFTMFHAQAKSNWLKVDSKPRDERRGIFDAAWA